MVEQLICLDLLCQNLELNVLFVKPRDTEGFKKAIQKNTKGIFGELVGNPGNELMNMPEISKIAHDAGIPLMVDATYQTPYFVKTFSLNMVLILLFIH